MGALIFAAIVLAGLVLSSRRASASTGPAPVAGGGVLAPVSVNDTTGQYLGSAGDIAQSVLDLRAKTASELNEDYVGILGSIGTGAAAGNAFVPGVGAVVGGMIGAAVGTIKAAWNSQDNVHLARVPFPWPEVGLPYRPDLVQWSADGLAMRVPYPNGLDFGNFTVPAVVLRELFPGNGALEAARRSGLFAWRPYDIATPWSDYLYSSLEHLRGYDQRYIRDTPDDFAGFTKWGEIGNLNTGNVEHVERLIKMARRIAAWRELPLPEPVIVTSDDEVCCSQQPKGVLLTSYDFQTWLWYRVAPAGDLAQRTRHARLLQTVAADADVAVLRCNPSDAGPCRLVPVVTGFGNYTAHRTPALRGFPGAWRLLAGDAGNTTAPIAEPAFPALVGVRPVVARVGASLAPSSDPINAFAFEVYLYNGARRVSSWKFVDLYGGSHAATLRALEAGELAWHPKRNTAPVRARWKAIDPQLDTITNTWPREWVAFA